jgi:hypothetical protein
MGALVFDLARTQRGKGVYRKALLDKLLESVPRSLMHANKDVINIECMNDSTATRPL